MSPQHNLILVTGATGAKAENPVAAEVDEIFGPSRKHIHERTERVAAAKLDDRLWR